MQIVDQINTRWGKGTVGVGSVLQSGAWRMREQRKTPNYMASVESMPSAS